MTASQDRRLTIATSGGIVDSGAWSSADDARARPDWPATLTLAWLANNPPTAEITQLTQRLFGADAPNADALRSVLFSSVDLKRGSEAVCVGAAQALATQLPKSICIVDANLGSGSLTDSFGLGTAKGLLNVFADDASVADCVGRLQGDLWFLPVGTGELRLPTLALGHLQRDLFSMFDYVFIEASGAVPGLDLTMWAPAIDGVVLVLDAGRTRRDAAARTANMLRAARINVLGAVLRNRTYPVPSPIYRRL